MSTRTLNWALLAALAVTVALGLAFRVDIARPGFEMFPDMARAPRADAFAASGVLAGGKVLQAPPPGTVPRGQPPLHFAATPADALRAGADLVSPFAPDEERSLARGGAVFATFCQPCHGAGGRGDGPVARRGFPPPASLLAEKALAMRDGQIFHILTYGQGNMPPYATQLSREDRWSAVSYVRWLQRQPTPPAS